MVYWSRFSYRYSRYLIKMINPWAYRKVLQPYLSVLHRKIISLVVLILRRLYTSKNYKTTKIHHFEWQTDHSRNQPTVLTITIPTNYTLLYRPIYFLYTLTHPTSRISNVLLIRLFAVFRIFLKTARRLFQYSVLEIEIAPKINFFSEVLLA